MAKTFGTFTKGSETRVASDAGEAVSLKFDGWAEVPESPTPEAPAAKKS